MLRLITATTTTSLKSYQLPFQNAEMVQSAIHNLSKTSSAVLVRFGVTCKSSLVQCISGGLVLSASHS
ncbi:hypothetical protein PS6_005847 [Mucor atramentarius]